MFQSVINCIVLLGWIQSVEYKFECPEGLTGRQKVLFQKATEVSNFDRNEAQWKTSCDVNQKLPEELKSRLWDENISVEMDRWIKGEPAIDRFGLKVDLDVYERHQKTWEKLASDLRKSTVKNRIPEACEEFADRLRTTLSAVRDKGELTAIVNFSCQKEREETKSEAITTGSFPTHSFSSIALRMRRSQTTSDCWICCQAGA